MTSSNEFDPEYFDYESALSIAREEALRDLVVRPNSISYVGYEHDFNDYCFCEFTLENEGWIKTIRGLLPQERLAGEEIQDKTIVEFARNGNMISAVRLYRTKHQVGLKEAVDAVNSLKYSDA
jgi:hypothetical protein